MYFAHKRKMMECQATLPCRAHVLVEEESEVRQHWVQIARDKKLALFVFSSVTSFLPTLHFWDAETEFYLDQDMYGKG